MKCYLNKNRDTRDPNITLTFNYGCYIISINKKTKKIVINMGDIHTFRYFPSILFTDIPDTEKRIIFKYYIHSVILKSLLLLGKVPRDLTTGKIKEFINKGYEFITNDNKENEISLERVVKL